MINQRLQQLIDDLGWSQERLANEMITSPSTISRWLSGKMPPSKTSLRRMAAVTKASLDWLLTGTGPMKISGTVAPKAQVASFKRAEDGPEKKESQPEIDVHKGVLMTTKVLSSKTGYANALWHNLKSFDAAVDREDEVGEMKEMMKEMMEKIDRLEQQLGGQPAKTEKKQAAN